jgi:hypothetical protein
MRHDDMLPGFAPPEPGRVGWSSLRSTVGPSGEGVAATRESMLPGFAAPARAARLPSSAALRTTIDSGDAEQALGLWHSAGGPRLLPREQMGPATLPPMRGAGPRRGAEVARPPGPVTARRTGPCPYPVPPGQPCPIGIEIPSINDCSKSGCTVENCAPGTPCRSSGCCCGACDKAIAELIDSGVAPAKVGCPPGCDPKCCLPPNQGCATCAARFKATGQCDLSCLAAGCCGDPCAMLKNDKTCTLEAHQSGCCKLTPCEFCNLLNIEAYGQPGPKACSFFESILGPLGENGSFCNCEKQPCSPNAWGGKTCMPPPNQYFGCPAGWAKRQDGVVPTADEPCVNCCKLAVPGPDGSPGAGIESGWCKDRCPCPPGLACVDFYLPQEQGGKTADKSDPKSECLPADAVVPGPNGCPPGYWFWNEKTCRCDKPQEPFGLGLEGPVGRSCNPCGPPVDGAYRIPLSNGKCSEPIHCAEYYGPPKILLDAHMAFLAGAIANNELGKGPFKCAESGNPLEYMCLSDNGFAKGSSTYLSPCTPSPANAATCCKTSKHKIAVYGKKP